MRYSPRQHLTTQYVYLFMVCVLTISGKQTAAVSENAEGLAHTTES
jgi:hypothetical protein